MSARGKLITLEGGEGVGKSTLAAALATALRERAHDIVLTREPGGSPGADAIRALLVRGAGDRWSPVSEALLFAAARCDHLERTILPALERGAWVICDRYIDSTYAYQVAAGGLAEQAFRTLPAMIGAPVPDLTFILDLDPSAGLARSQGAAAGEDRYEQMDAEFHAEVRDAFLELAQREANRCIVFNAALPRETLLQDALIVIEARLA